MKASLMLGVNNETKREDNDFYATDPNGLRIALPILEKIGLNKNIWECSCGNGNLSKVLEENNYKVYSTDLIDRGYGIGGIDFLSQDKIYDCDILTNPSFKLADKFVEKGMKLLKDGNHIILFLKVQFLESKSRKALFEKYPPKYVIVNSERICCAMNGDFDKYFNYDNKKEKYVGGTQFYCWYYWEKGYNGDTVIKWI